MNRRQFTAMAGIGLLASTRSGLSTGVSNQKSRYGRGSVISDNVFVTELNGQNIEVHKLLKQNAKPLSLIFIFGGGGLGHKRTMDTGGIWCPDSYEDLHILRTLHDNFKDEVAFLPVACPPVFHSKMLGFEDRAFLDYDKSTKAYISAKQAFIDSTNDAFKSGLIPVEPYMDLRFRLLMGEKQQAALSSAYGSVPEWQGSFRDKFEKQSYGVPNFWMVNKAGEIVREPYRGNIYHPHGGELQINYTVQDLADDLKQELAVKGI